MSRALSSLASAPNITPVSPAAVIHAVATAPWRELRARRLLGVRVLNRRLRRNDRLERHGVIPSTIGAATWSRTLSILLLSIMLMITVGTAVGCSREQQISGHSVDYWERALKSPDSAVRVVAAQRFVATAPPSEATAQVLVSALATESNHNVHVTIAHALGTLGPAAAGSVPELTRLLRDEHDDVRQAVAQALGNLGPAAAPAVSALADATADRDHEVRIAAVEALGKIGPRARAAIPALAAAVHDPISYVRLEAVNTLVQIAPSDSLAQSALAHALGDSQEDVGLAACQGIRTALRLQGAAPPNTNAGPVTGELTAALQRAKGDSDTAVSSCAAGVLQLIDR